MDLIFKLIVLTFSSKNLPPAFAEAASQRQVAPLCQRWVIPPFCKRWTSVVSQKRVSLKVIPAEAGIQIEKTGFRIKSGMT